MSTATIRAAVEARYDAQILAELTNPRSNNVATVNTVKLDQAVVSMQTYFATYVQAVFDEDDDQHLEVGITGVIATLQKWGGSSAGVSRIDWTEWKEECRELKQVGPRGHEGPVGDADQAVSPTTKTELQGNVRHYPDFDPRYFTDQIPTRRAGHSRFNAGRLE